MEKWQTKLIGYKSLHLDDWIYLGEEVAGIFNNV